MSATELLQPILDGGIRYVKFFNGRLLSGEDLSDEQAANREGRKRLGQSLGEGVALGLEVSEAAGLSKRDAPVLTINAGMAVNRQGQTLKLAAPNSLSLIRQSIADTTSGGIFKDCQQTQLQSGVQLAGAGVYLLTIAPAEGSAGRAPVSGLGNTSITCNARYTVEGVQFRLLQLNIPDTYLGAPGHLRNRVAYGCLGTDLISDDPFAPQSSQYGLADALRPNSLTDYDVPLALIYWTASDGITFLDQWSVRRRLTARGATDRWAHLLSDRRVSETEAMILQFEEHVEDILLKEQKLAASIIATERFVFLPPAGLLPVGSQATFDQAMFFKGITDKFDSPQLEVGLLRSLFHEALYHEPVDIKSLGQVQLFAIPRSPNVIVFASIPLSRSFKNIIQGPPPDKAK